MLTFFYICISTCLLQVYIVYMGAKTVDDPRSIENSHYEMLTNLLGSKEAAKESILYNYKYGFSGFAAMLSDSQAMNLSGFSNVVRVFPSTLLSLHTTRSWDFLQVKSEVSSGILRKSQNGSGSIIGILDSGVWPESESFKDEDMGPIPSHWKGICQEGENFTLSNCNRKIIGARWYIKGYEASKGNLNTSGLVDFLSPRDSNGHGTHAASIAAGAFVQNASFIGLAQGLARGGAPSAFLAIYKVCWESKGSLTTCSAADILSAFDDAIYDGVDVLSISIGSSLPYDPYVADVESIGSFHAVDKGISVVYSAGNNGPNPETVDHTAPWIISVAAATIDRAYPTLLTLGSNQTFLGQALNTWEDAQDFYPLVYANSIASIHADGEDAKNCKIDTLNATLARGKVVLCFQTETQSSLDQAYLAIVFSDAVGVIFAIAPSKEIIPSYIFPAVQVDYIVGTSLLKYVKSKRHPTVKISVTTTSVGKQIAPEVADFSSRGPSSLSPSVLKPDIAAPGVNILAAWSPNSLLFPVNYRIVSGTSMACPHISGIIALIKAIYPTWSPAAIKSAIVTTASINDVYGQNIVAEGLPRKLADAFDFGGGVVNPNKAIDPGLVFDMETSDYVNFLCSMGYNESAISKMTRTQIQCSVTPDFLGNFNLPSISIPELKNFLTISRTVTNVGPINSLYFSRIEAPPGISLMVNPPVLIFTGSRQKLMFKVTVCSQVRVQGRYSFGYLLWVSHWHSVRMPVIVRPIIDDFAADA
ncbi:subtilisin-like protease SBT3.9 [Malania oleifera]|uniref:subtilisin-like protease SBT3.9 n=1 Tax=Malania oleifera TaxID=397392 RepID=UPI0025AE56F3|nr:subtilisin-like protease SBT3.9 [Malania oleifera]